MCVCACMNAPVCVVFVRCVCVCVCVCGGGGLVYTFDPQQRRVLNKGDISPNKHSRQLKCCLYCEVNEPTVKC